MKNTVRLMSTLFLLLAVATSIGLADAASDEAAIRSMLDNTWKKVGDKKYDGKELNADGAWQATSQGGLWQRVDREGQIAVINDSPNVLSVAANHAEVTFLGSKKDVAYVHFYLTGTIRMPDGNTIPDYRTRASWVVEKQGGSWVVSAAHYSPLFGGSGVRFD